MIINAEIKKTAEWGLATQPLRRRTDEEIIRLSINDCNTLAKVG
jgi:hypothetical protein